HLSKAPWARGGEELGVRSEELEQRSQEPEARSQESGISSFTPYPSPLPPPPSWYSANFQPLKEVSSFSHIGRLPFSSLTVIGQLKGTYILCQSKEHFVLLDQHAAHERIGFERLRSQARSGGIAVQRLLSPQLMEIREAEMEWGKPHLASLEKFGLLVEEFGPQTLAVKGAPALLGPTDSEPLMRDLIREIQEHGQSTKLEDRLDEIFATMAC